MLLMLTAGLISSPTLVCHAPVASAADTDHVTADSLAHPRSVNLPNGIRIVSQVSVVNERL